MKKTKALLAIVLALLFCLTLSLAACECEHEFVDGKCVKCGADEPGYVPPTPTPSKAVITVNPAEMTVTPDDEVVLLFGVSATLNGQDTEVTVADDGGFDPDDMQEGVYTITYQAGTGDSRSTATRKITVEAPKSRLALEVRQNLLGETKWQGKLLTFKNALYVELTQDTELTAQSGVFHNKGTSAIKLNVEGAYGCSAVLDQNGVVLEGRDGANSKLVNAANPTRAGSSVTTIKVGEEDVAVSNAFAKELTIPAGGYAVVIQAKYASEAGADFDGRGYMNYNVIYQVGNVVRLYWVDQGVTEGLLTPYVNQAPYVVTNNAIYADLGDEDFNLETAVKEGLIIKDDNGTFDISDDVTLQAASISVTDNDGFDINVVKVYTITLSATDGTLAQTLTRKIEVTGEYVTLTIDDKSFKAVPDKVIHNQEVTASSAAKYKMIILDKDYTGAFAANGYGAAIVLDKFGALVRIYDGANLGLWDKDGKAATTPFTTANYATYAWENLAEGETLIVFPNDGGTNEARGFALSLRPNVSKGYFGVVCSLTGFTFEEKSYTVTVGEGDNAPKFTAAKDKYAFNDAVTNPASYKMIVFTKDAGEINLTTYKFGNALIVDKYGVIKSVYSGSAKAGIYTSSGKTALAGDVYATEAYKALGADDMLIIFPNDGTNGPDSARAFVDNLIGSDNAASVLGKAITLTDVTFADPDAPELTEVTVKFGDKEIKINVENVAINPTATGSIDLAIYTTEYKGAGIATGWGIVVIVKDGKIDRIFDGISAKVYDKEHPEGTTGCTSAGYLSEALCSLKANEYALVGWNHGAATFRTFLRTTDNRKLESVATVTGIEIKTANKDMTYVQVNGKTYFNPAVAANAEVNNIANYDLAIYGYGYSGIRLVNAFGVIYVYDAEGKIVYLYDHFGQKYYDAENPAGIALPAEIGAAATIATDIFNNLRPGQTMIVGINGGANGGAARSWLSGCKTDAIGKDVVLGGITVTAATTEVKYVSVTVGNKTWYQDITKMAIDAEYTGTPVFAIYNHGYAGNKISGGYGVAFIVDEATGKVVKIYDGATAKYYDAENPAGVQNGTCTAEGYISEAFAALEEGQYVLIAPNGGTTGNVARGFLSGSRVIGTAVSYVVPQTAPEQGGTTPEQQG